jgi:hypothetical protein
MAAMTTSSDTAKRILLGLSKEGATMFRNNVAQGIVGDPKVWIKHEQTITVRPGDIVVRNGRVLHAGLHEGSGDFIGWTPLLITQAWVGRTVPVFTSIEAKSGRGALEPAQKNWDRVIRAAGGVSGVAYSPEQAVEVIRAYRRGATSQ